MMTLPILLAFCLNIWAADLREGIVIVKQDGEHRITAETLPAEKSPLASDYYLFTERVLSELKEALEYFELKGSAALTFSLKTGETPRVQAKIDFEDPDVDPKSLESALPEPADLELPARNLARRILGSIFSCMET